MRLIWRRWTRGVRPEIRLAALFTMFTPLLGGAVRPWQQGVVLILFAGLLLFTRRERKIPWFAWVLTLVLLIPVVASFFPVVGPAPSWRVTVERDLELPLGSLLTAQPWLTAEGAFLLLSCVMIWMWWRSRWLMPQERWFLMRAFCGGVLLMALISICCNRTGWRIPFWESPLNFGPFPNRNQTANLLAIGAVAMLACAHHAMRVRRRLSYWGWIGALLVTLLAIVLNYSRAGILLFGVGALAWLCSSVLASRKPQARFMVAGGMLIFLLGGFFLFGGDTLKRVQHTVGEDGSVTRDFRLKLYRDAFQLWREQPLLGVGYGNFEGVFNFYRDTSVSFNRARHPDSDWVWLASEGGMISVLAVLGLIAWSLSGLVPFRREKDRTARLAAATGVGLFLFHSLFDVPGHRLGTLLPVLMLMAVAQSPRRRFGSGAGFGTPIFLLMGLLMAGVGIAWITATSWRLPWPGRVGIDNALALARERSGNPEVAYGRVAQALEWAPLELELHLWQANLVVRTGRPLAEAAQSFRRVRGLEMFSPEMTLKEAGFWIEVNPPSAMPALGETLARAGDKWPDFLPHVISLATRHEMTREWLRRMCATRNEWRLFYLKTTTADEFRTEVSRLLEEDPTLSSVASEQWNLLFDAAVDRDPDFLISESVTGNEKWMKQAWPYVAKVLAARDRVPEAVRLVRNYAPAPVLPARPLHMEMDELNEAFAVRPHDFSLAYAMYFAQLGSGQWELALGALRQVSSLPDCPAYFYFLEFELLERLQKWPEAWARWVEYKARERAPRRSP